MARPHLPRRRRSASTAPATTQATPQATPQAPADPTAEQRTGTTTVAEREEPAATPAPPPRARRTGIARVLDVTPLLLLRAAHPRQAVLTAVLMTVAAALADRPTRDLGLVLATVLVGQAILGWHNDLVDRARDAAHGARGKPLADGRLDPGTAWFAIACGVLAVVPLAVAHGTVAGLLYLASLLVGLLGNLVLRTGLLSFVPWAAAFATYPAFLSYGGWGGVGTGEAPQPAMVALAALLGVGVHVLSALWGLVPDHEDGWTYLPLRLGRRLGAARLLTLTCVYLALVVAAMAYVGTTVGLVAP